MFSVSVQPVYFATKFSILAIDTVIKYGQGRSCFDTCHF